MRDCGTQGATHDPIARGIIHRYRCDERIESGGWRNRIIRQQPASDAGAGWAAGKTQKLLIWQEDGSRRLPVASAKVTPEWPTHEIAHAIFSGGQSRETEGVGLKPVGIEDFIFQIEVCLPMPGRATPSCNGVGNVPGRAAAADQIEIRFHAVEEKVGKEKNRID